MIYRALGRTELEVSEIGLGCEHLQGKEQNTITSVVSAAIDGGINVMDVFMSEPEVRSALGKALDGRREKMQIQGHIGAAWKNGQYARSRDIGECMFFFEDLLERLDTDYIDLGMLHYCDELSDLQAIQNGPVYEYARALKASGRIRALGISTHNPIVAAEAVRQGMVDMLMFSVNPLYDLLPGNTDLLRCFENQTYEAASLTFTHPDRAALYRLCEEKGVGITVMKGLAAGVLLDEKRSPLGRALTVPKLIHYALTRPAVASVLVGCKTPEEVQAAIAYENASESERDFSEILAGSAKFSDRGICMYCNHCLPCPQKIDIAAVNRCLDSNLTEAYAALSRKAGDCVECGGCETRCPFDVKVTEKMCLAKARFGA